MKSKLLITKPYMISVSEPLNSPLQPMVISTISYLLLCLVLLAQSDSQVNSTPISENSLLTLFHSQDSISSWLVSLLLPQEDPKYIELLPYQNSPNKCSMPKIWCALQIQDTEDILLPPLCSEEECPPKRLTNKCSTYRTKTPPISSNGFQTTLNPLFVISHQRVLKCLLLSLVTLLLSKKCSRESLNNSLLCSEEKLSSIGILVKVWMRWSSLKLNQTWTIWSENTNNGKKPQLKMKLKTKRKKKMKNDPTQHNLKNTLYYFSFL